MDRSRRLSRVLIAACAITFVNATGTAQERASVSPLAPPLPPANPIEPTLPVRQQFYLRKLEFTPGTGNSRGHLRTKDVLIRHMIPLSPGDLFNTSLWEAGIEQLNRSGLFEPITPADIVLRPEPLTGFVDVELKLTEADHRRVDFSGGGGTTGGAGGQFDYSDINLTGRGDRLRTRLLLGTREQSASAQYSLSLISRRQPVIDLSGYFQRSVFVDATLENGSRDPLFRQTSAGASAGLEFALSKTRYAISAPSRLGIVYSFSSTGLTDRLATSPISTATTEERLRSGSLTTFVVHDTLDRHFDPQEGQRLFAAIQVSAIALGGSLNTLKPSFDYRRFFRLRARNEDSRSDSPAFGLRFRANHIVSFGERFDGETLSTVDGVPIYNRSFVGGEEQIRGFDLNSIAPLARIDRFVPSSTGEPTLVSTEVRPIGGDTELVFNAEYRYPLVWRLSAAAFFDIGASINARRLQREQFVSTVPNIPLGTIEVTTVLDPAPGAEFELPKYRYSFGGELRFPIPVLNIPIRLIFAVNPNAQTNPPAGAFIAPERRYAFRIGFSRTL